MRRRVLAIHRCFRALYLSLCLVAFLASYLPVCLHVTVSAFSWPGPRYARRCLAPTSPAAAACCSTSWLGPRP